MSLQSPDSILQLPALITFNFKPELIQPIPESFLPRLVVFGLLLFLLPTLCVFFHRLCLSPLAKFPGPKLAAATWWYECYFDVLKPDGGLYIWKVKELHQKYGKPRLHECWKAYL